MRATGDGGFVAVGEDAPNGGGGGVVVKYDAEVGIDWTYEIDDDRFEELHAAATAGTIVIAGKRGDADGKNRRPFLVHLDFAGNELAVRDIAVLDFGFGRATLESLGGDRFLLGLPDRFLEIEINGDVVQTVPTGCMPKSVQRTADGGTLVAGRRCLKKFDAGGAVVWEPGTTGQPETGRSVAETFSGGFQVLGEIGSTGANWLLRTDSDGNILSQRTYSAVGRLRTIRATDDGFVMAGDDGTHGLVIKLNGLGNELWQKTYSETGDITGVVVAGTEYVVSGAFGWLAKLGKDGDIVAETRYPVAFAKPAAASDGGWFVLSISIDSHIRLAKLDADFAPIWQARIGDANAAENRGIDVMGNGEGGCVIAANTTQFGGGDICFARICPNLWLVGFDADGNVAWQRSYSSRVSDECCDLLATDDGGILLTAYSDAFHYPQEDAWLFKLDVVGLLSESCPSSIAAATDGTFSTLVGGVIEEAESAVSGATVSTGAIALGSTPHPLLTGIACVGVGTAGPPPANGDPVPTFGTSIAAPETDEPITFDATASQDDGTIVSYDWDFENDGTFDATGTVVNHAYTAAGTFTARLRVTDNGGRTAETTREITVTPAAPAGPSITIKFMGVGGAQVDVRISGETEVCTTDCTLAAPANQRVRIEVFTNDGTIFDHWVGCDQDFGEEGCLVDIGTTPRTVEVHLAPE